MVVVGWVGIALAVLVCAAPDAQAMDWKDGCPALERAPHYDFGIATRPDTSLTRTQWGVASRLTHLTRDVGNTGYVLDHKFFATYSTKNESPHGFTATLTADFVTHASPSDDRFGNFGALAGYRHSRLVLADAVRFGVAARIGTATALREADPQNGGNDLAARLPMDAQAHAFDHPLFGSIEARAELVGCQSAFVWARADVVSWRYLDPTRGATLQRISVIPLAIAIGGYLRPRVGIALEWATQLASDEQPVVPSTINRFGTTMHFQIFSYLSVDVTLAGLTGDRDGAEVRTTVRVKYQ